jgi:flagellar basal-body rod modification protein FlgD
MSIESITSNTTKIGNDKIFNPNSQLDKDAFMKLFLKQLQMQDPTNPMDTDKMLEETSSLSTMEMNTNMQKTLNNLSQTLLSSSQLSTISAIGKIADTHNRYLNITNEDTQKDFELYFQNDIKNGKIKIEDSNGNIVKEINLDTHSKGLLNFEWDLKDNNGKRVENGNYKVFAEYEDNNGISHNALLGVYPIESIKFENNKAYAKIGNQYVPFSQIKEIY